MITLQSTEYCRGHWKCLTLENCGEILKRLICLKKEALWQIIPLNDFHNIFQNVATRTFNMPCLATN